MSVTAQRQLHPLDAEAIWRDFHGRLLGFIARRVGDRGSAEDILQEVMLRIHRHVGELDRRGDITSYRRRGGSCDCRTAKAVE